MRLSLIPARYVIPAFLLVVFCAPVILGPLLYLVLEPFGIPFHRAMSRALLVSAIGALCLFRGRLRLRAWWPKGKIAWRQLAMGFLLAAVSGQAMIGFYLAFRGFHSAELPLKTAGLKVGLALVAGLIVPVLEETIFRGFLVTVLVEAAGKRAGWILAALIYAVAHFLKVPAAAPGQSIHVWSGFAGIVSIFTHLGSGEFLSGRGLNLFLVGLILGGIFLRAGTLWPGAALHGGWIMILMSFSALTRPSDPPYVSFLGQDLLGNPLTSAVLLMLGFWLWKYYHPPLQSRSAASVETTTDEKLSSRQWRS